MLRRSSSLISDSQLSSQSSSQDDSAPKEVYVPVKRKTRKPPLPKLSQWACIVPEGMLPMTSTTTTTEDHPSFISLRNPKTGCLGKYMLDADRNEICEVLKFSDEPRSWFIGNSVQTDGSLFMCTPIDPLFLALPYLIKAAKSGKFTTLDAILEDTSCSCDILENCMTADQWEHICDLKVLHSGNRVYRYSEVKTLQWLRKKVEALSENLQEHNVYVGAGSCSSTFIRSKKKSGVTREDYVCYACGMVSDYLSSDLAGKLTKSFSFTDVAARKLSQAEECNDVEPPTKKPHLEVEGDMASGEPLEDYTKVTAIPADVLLKVQASKPTQAQRLLSKVDKTGMKSLTSFFGGKTSKKS